MVQLVNLIYNSSKFAHVLTRAYEHLPVELKNDSQFFLSINVVKRLY